MLLILLLICFSSSYSQSDSLGCNTPQPLICPVIEVMPTISGGLESLQKSLVYPTQALQNKIEGKVYVLTTIDSNGVQLCHKIIKGLGYGCDEEAIRIISKAKFYPGYQRNKPVKVSVAIPIIFKLPGNNK